MEWWEMQDKMESEGWKFRGDMLVWPDGWCTPLCTSLTPEGMVRHAYEFVESLKRNAPNWVSGAQGRADHLR